MITPALRLDFTSIFLGTQITFSRALDTATRVNNLGYIELVDANTLRFDYDPTTLECKGLLIEESRTNLRDYSNLFNNWSSKSNVTVSDETQLSPDNTTNASRITAAGTNPNLRLGQSGLASGTVYTISFYMSTSSTSTAVRMWNLNFAGSSVYNDVRFNPQTGNPLSGNTGYLVEDGPNGYKRYSFSFTCDSSNGIQLYFYPTSGVDNGNSLDIYGFQLESGSFATSLIPTSGAIVNRNSDVATIVNTDFSNFWRSTKGGVVVRALPSITSGVRPLIQFDDNTADNVIALRNNTTNPELYIKATTDQAQIDAGTIAANTEYKLGATWEANNCAANLNGGVPVLDTSATIPTVTQARLGSDGTNYLNGHLQSIEYYDQRILNSGLQILSGSARYRSIFNTILSNSIIK